MEHSTRLPAVMVGSVNSFIGLVRTTKHATVRMEEANMPYKKLVFMLLHGEYEKLPKDLSRQKRRRYNGNEEVFYVRYGPYVFTCVNKKDGQDRDITLVITMIDQRETLKVAPREDAWIH